MYVLERYPTDIDNYSTTQLRYINVRNAVRRVLNSGARCSGQGIMALVRYLPAEERQELAALLPQNGGDRDHG